MGGVEEGSEAVNAIAPNHKPCPKSAVERVSRGPKFIGLARFCQAHWKEAAAAFERAVALKPDFAQAHHNLGLARARAGDSPGAIASLREAIRCTPGDPGPWVALTEELLGAQRVAEARASLEHLERLQPNHPALAPLRDRLRPGR